MLLKNVNRFSVLNYIRRHRFTTKAALAAESGLTFMTIQKIMEELLALGLVRQDAYEGGYVGRRALTYTIDENYGYTLGLHINMFETRAALLNLRGEILSHRSLNMEGLEDDISEFINAMAAMVKDLAGGKETEKAKILGLGIGAPGPINTAEGRVMSPPNLKMLRYLPLRQIMSDALGMPVLLHKDTNAIARGEYWRGAGAGYSNMVYIDADMGIGSGLILNGVLHEGANSVAGEFGHITIDPQGPLCNCGSRGCLEAMGSGISILRDFKQQLAEKPKHSLAAEARADAPVEAAASAVTIQQILNAGGAGNPLAVSILNNAAYHMGSAIGNLINILDPDIIILGGILVLQYEPYFAIVRDTALRKRLAGARENLIVPAANASRAGVIGAGELVADNFFSRLVNDVLSKETR
jgi:predicted NBD/HSP70 family sugar kinase